MADCNQIFIIGRVGQDPTTGVTNNGNLYANFSIAHNRSWTKDDGATWEQETTWVFCKAYKSTADHASKFVTGDKVFVSGALKSYKNEKGTHYYVMVNEVKKLESSTKSTSSQPKKEKKPTQKKEQYEVDYGLPAADLSDDDLPF